MYINGVGAITPQLTHTGNFPFEFIPVQSQALACQEPEYKDYIPPRTSRRMSRVVKMGVTAALMALDGDINKTPDAIITGSGFGCMGDTEKFLTAIIENQEKFLNPAPFIHSTHNTISSQIALFLKCTGYNQTYVHGPFSFESALLDALMALQDNNFKSVLVGGIDEMTPRLLQITRRFGMWKTKAISNAELLSSTSKGTLAGEGACFFRIEQTASSQSFARVVDINTSHGHRTEEEIRKRIEDFLSVNHLNLDDLDLCFSGKNGDNRTDGIYNGLQTSLFADIATGYFKHLCGEYFTSSAFAVWFAASILKKQQIPDYVNLSKPKPANIKQLLVVNHTQSGYLSLILLKAC